MLRKKKVKRIEPETYTLPEPVEEQEVEEEEVIEEEVVEEEIAEEPVVVQTRPKLKPQPKKPREITMVVKELPTQELRRVEQKDGTIVNLITIEEALTRFMLEEEE